MNSRFAAAAELARSEAFAAEILLNNGLDQAAAQSYRRCVRLCRMLLRSHTLPANESEKSLQAGLRIAFPQPTIPPRHNELDHKNFRRGLYDAYAMLTQLADGLKRRKWIDRSSALRALAAILTVVVLVGSAHMLIFTSQHREDPPTVAQEHFFNTGMDDLMSVLFLGKNGELITEDRGFSLPERYELSVNGFYVRPGIIQRNPLAVSHYITADHDGSLRLKFPQGSPLQAVSVFAWGANRYSRGSLIESDDFRQILLADNYGRWIRIPLTEKERRQGYKKVNFTTLTAGGVAVSAVALNGLKDPEL
ncbi:MAG: hypothetical protein KDD66_03085 [Bdellovibrionales bacterium]|nr:hypothetical protein [Bdellovibrionales bacterium]